MTTSRLQRFPTGLLLAAFLAFPSVASATSADEERSLVTYLTGHHFKPDRRVLDRISPETNRLLVRIASDAHQRPTLRVRAVTSLSLYPSLRTKRYLLGLFHERSLKGTNTGLLLRVEALRSSARAFRGKVADDIKALRDDADIQIRAAVAQALGDTGSKRLLPYLRAWLPHEKTFFVRGVIDQTIDRLERL